MVDCLFASVCVNQHVSADPPLHQSRDEMEAYQATQSDAGKRLDQWLNEATPFALSRTRIKQLIQGGHVVLNDEVVTEAKRKVTTGDVARLHLPDLADPDPLPENIALDVLHEDSDLIVINKPSGLVVHPGAGNASGTLVNALLHHCGDSLSGIGGVKRPGIVHRLDKETSGVMVVAKHDTAHKHLSAQFADHGRAGSLRRVYRALIWGAPNAAHVTIKTFLGRSSSDRTKQAVVSDNQPDARHAVTHCEMIARFGSRDGSDHVASLVDCSLETGRTHQIRVHMAHIGHPLIGDHIYGGGYRTKANILPGCLSDAVGAFRRQALHARLLAFEHPGTGEVMDFTAPEPDDMQALIDGFTQL
jgi:23S rRNA pseudouridine1911/1915/1917 synthase